MDRSITYTPASTGPVAPRPGAMNARDPVVVEDNTVVTVADNFGAQSHMNKVGACARHQIKEIEIEKKRSAVEKQKTLL